MTLLWDTPVGGTPPSGYAPQQCQAPNGGTTCTPVTIPNVTLALTPRSWTVDVDVSSGPATYCWAMTAVKTGMTPSKPSNTVCQLMQAQPLETPGNLRIAPTALRAHLRKPGAIKGTSGR